MKLAIIGGGIGGLALAAGLEKIGIKAHIFEKASAFKPVGAGLGLGSNAVQALDQMGLARDVRKSGMRLESQRFLNADLKEMNRIDFSILKELYGEYTITIHRADLHEVLFQAADHNYIHFNQTVTALAQNNDYAAVTCSDGVTHNFDCVIGADGIDSAVRQTLIPNSKPRYAGYTCWRGIAPNPGNVVPYVSSEAWSERGRFGWAPLSDGTVYWFACVNAWANDEYYANLTKEGTAEIFKHFSPMIEQLIRETTDDVFLHHDIYDIKPLDKYVYGRIALMGDAAHAATPNMGQGAGQSIEDAYELVNAIDGEATIENAMKRYESKRIKKANRVIEKSRWIGEAAQWEHPLLVKFRNTVLPLIPRFLLFRQLNFLFKSQ